MQALYPHEVELLGRNYDLEEIVTQYRVSDVDDLLRVLNHLQKHDKMKDHRRDSSENSTHNPFLKPKNRANENYDDVKSFTHMVSSNHSTGNNFYINREDKGQR